MLLTNSSSDNYDVEDPYFNGSSLIKFPVVSEDPSGPAAAPVYEYVIGADSPIEPSPSRFFTFSTPAYRPEKYSVIVDQRFLVAIDNETNGFTKVVQRAANLQATSQPKVENAGFAGTGCVEISLAPNSSAVQTAVVAQLNEADLAASRSNDSELPWSHCNGTCSITVPTAAESTYATAVGGPAPFAFSTNYTLRPNGYSGCVRALNQLTTVQKNSFFYKPHPLIASYAAPVVLVSQTLAPLSQVVVAAMVNTSCTYLSGSMGDEYGEDMFLKVVEESILVPYLGFQNPDADKVDTRAECNLAYGCSYEDGDFAQFRLDPMKTYYLLLNNSAPVTQNATVHLNLRDNASCKNDGHKVYNYSDTAKGRNVSVALTPEAQRGLDQEGGQAACLAAGLTASCTAG